MNTPASQEAPPTTGAAQPPAECGGKVFDRATLVERVDGDEELLRELIEIFLQDSPRMFDEIAQAVAAGDALQLCHAAHALKGSAATMAGDATRQAAWELEQIGRDGRPGDAPPAMEALRRELALFTSELQRTLAT